MHGSYCTFENVEQYGFRNIDIDPRDNIQFGRN